jgi:hypothetical protein
LQIAPIACCKFINAVYNECMPKTNAEKLRERTNELEQLARSLGFDNYSAMSTYLKNQHKAGEPIKLTVGNQVFKSQPPQTRPPRA